MSSLNDIRIFIVLFFISIHTYLAYSYSTPASDINYYSNISNNYCQAFYYNQEFNYSDVEYPPLTILWMSIPGLIVGPASFNNVQWLITFKTLYLIFHCIIFLSINNKPKNNLLPRIIYTLSGIFLLNFLYDRQDLWLGGLILFGVIALIKKTHWTIPLLVLAIGINFKLVPIILIPLFIIGGIANGLVKQSIFTRKIFWVMSKRLLIIIGFTLLIFLPFYLWGGDGTLYFLSYHRDRGLQLESTYSSILMALHYAGLPVHVGHGFGAYNLESPIAGILARLSPFLLVTLILYLFYILIKYLLYRSRIPQNYLQDEKHDKLTLAQTYPQAFITIAIAILLGSICVSKVLSPQYLLWLPGLYAMLNYDSRYQKISGYLFLAACALTTPIFPYLYYTEFVHDSSGYSTWAAPTPLATILLLSRNSLLVGSLIYLVKSLGKRKENLSISTL